MLLFCVAHTGIDRVAPAGHIDARYADTLYAAGQQGVEVMAVGCHITPGTIGVVGTLPVVPEPAPESRRGRGPAAQVARSASSKVRSRR